MSRTKLLMTAASLILLVTYVVPVWSIALDAPQYPEGLGLEIWLHTIDGANPHDLNKINNLNHYIGMKTIEPDAIAELVYMPWIVAFMIVLGLAAAWRDDPRLVRAWVVLFLLIAVAGLVDFWWWTYDYGHNLDTENAIIKVPGMTYQPPLIGSKQLLNFRAVSLPHIGGIVIGVSILLGMAAAWLHRKRGAAVKTEALQ